ncbi:MAG: dihydrodipicolinate synthase family protein [Tepidisphaeraceae bacterium]|jgi:4-hydroxy-tetrahydrodipicolinate synthase
MREPGFFSGVVVPMISPFTPEGRVDATAAAGLVQRLIGAGVHGIFVLGTTGESASMSWQQKRQMVEAAASAVHAAPRRVALYAGISGNSLRESLDAAAEWRELGADALVAHPPYYFPITDSMQEAYFAKLADSLPLPLLLYNIPQTTHVSIPLEAVGRLSRHPNIIGIKDSQRDLPRFTRLIEQYRNENFRVLCGSISQALQCLRLGAHGLVPSTANFAPEIYVAMYNAANAGNWPDAEELQTRSLEQSARYQQGVTLGESIAALKAIMAEQKICSAAVLPPLQTRNPSCG